MSGLDLKRAFFPQLRDVSELLGVMDLLPDVSFFLKDRQGRFVALNRRGCEYCGVESEEAALGKTDHDFFPSERADAYHADDLAVMERDEPILNRLESAPETDGSPRLVMTSKLPLHGKSGEVIGVFGISRRAEALRNRSDNAHRFAELIDFMHRNFSDPLTTANLAKRANLSVGHFERRFRESFGTSPRQFLLRIRVEEASRLLRQSELSISEIALRCGFHDHAHFSRQFKTRRGCAPSIYRRNTR